MCGIFGICYRTSAEAPPETTLHESARLLAHRGPDAAGVYSGAGIGLAHTRLTFVDVDARSNQPFWDEQGRHALVFNGEIYNFKDLRSELAGRGVRFRTTSDTEVLLQLLLTDGPERALPRLAGMFAFALVDVQEATVLLARDRFGMKPLYVYEDGSRLMFASEITAMRPWWSPEIDRFSIASYLLDFGGPTKGFTFYRGLRILPPGTTALFRRGRPVEQTPFFEVTDFWSAERVDELRRESPDAMADRLERLLLESVEKHIFADVPVGAFCSGGVDSSLIMAMAARTHTNLAIFHANVKGAWSEHHAASALARHLRLDLKSVDVSDQDFVDRLPDVMAHYEHPYTYMPNCAPLMMVSQLAHEHGVKGLLSGEGSDECFLGYPWLGRKRLTDAYERVGRGLRSLVHRIPEIGRILWPYEGETLGAVRALLNRREIEDDRAAVRRVLTTAGARIPERDAWSLDYMGHHLRALLQRNDTMGMSASIEARFPFLDHAVVELAVNMPTSLKLRFSPTVFEKAHPFIRDKWIVRRVADRYIPRALSQRVKLGFWTTVFQRCLVQPALFDQSFVRDVFELSQPQMRAVLDAADRDLTMRLLHLEVWGRVCVEARPRDEVRHRIVPHITVVPERAFGW